jgi:hypothetical protein
MTRLARARLTLATGAAALVVSLAGCGGSSSSSQSGGGSVAPPSTSTTTSSAASSSVPGRSGAARASLTVTPRTGPATATFSFSFRAPAASGRHGHTELAYSLTVAGPSGPGCVAVHAATLPKAGVGQLVRARLGPAQLRGSWCPGTYRARADEVERAVCQAGQVCPQFIRLVAVVGPATFRVSG